MALRAWSNVSPEEAVASLVDRIDAVPTRRVPLVDSAGAVLRQAIFADRPSPAADVSAMDGYAVRRADAGEGRLRVCESSLPGREPASLEPGSAMRIFTGSGVPSGADAVIKREDVGEQERWIDVPSELDVKAGANIRRRGENVRAGDEIAGVGDLLHSARIGALRAFGADEVEVSRPVRVGVITTGDEVVTGSPNDWQVRDSNGAAIEAWCRRTTWCEAPRRDHAIDDLGALADLVGRRLEEVDLLLMTGGVSVGDHDHVRDALQAHGIDPLFHGVTQRPGKPALGAVSDGGVPIIALPGNPVSVLVGLRRLVQPVLTRLVGMSRGTAGDGGPDAHVQLARADGKTLWLTWFRLVRHTGAGRVELVETRGSGDLASSARADGFVQIEPDANGEGLLPFYRWT